MKHIKKFNENYNQDKLDLQRDQHLFSLSLYRTIKTIQL